MSITGSSLIMSELTELYNKYSQGILFTINCNQVKYKRTAFESSVLNEP